MASPNALSPPYPSPASLPSKKRSIDAVGASSSAQKRRKASAVASAAHPPGSRLRTTSFPTPEARSPLARSPSVDAMSHVSGSQVSGTTTNTNTQGGKKKRGRKAKNAATGGLESKEQTPSLVGGHAPTVASGAGRGADDTGNAGEEEEEHDGKLSLVVVEERKEQKEQEIRMRAMLVDEMDPQQQAQYENWRAFKFPDAVVRRIVNAAVSQSLPATVVLAVRTVAKVFMGQLIEDARKIQLEMIAAGEEQAEVPEPPPLGAVDDDTIREPRVGPLRPEHLREAYYRYKMSGEGGGVGFQGLWHAQQQDGVERFGSRTGGRRIFR